MSGQAVSMNRGETTVVERLLAAGALFGAFFACVLICLAADRALQHGPAAAIVPAVLSLAGFGMAQLGQWHFERVSRSRDRTDPKSESVWRQDLRYARYLRSSIGVPGWLMVCLCAVPFVWLVLRAVLAAL